MKKYLIHIVTDGDFCFHSFDEYYEDGEYKIPVETNNLSKFLQLLRDDNDSIDPWLKEQINHMFNSILLYGETFVYANVYAHNYEMSVLELPYTFDQYICKEGD